MKTKIVIIVLAVTCVGLLIALVSAQHQSSDQRTTEEAAISDFSNQLATARTSLDDLSQVNLKLTNDLAQAEQQVEQLSNSLNETSAALGGVKTSLQGAQDQITTLNSRINDLETQNKVLGSNAMDLTNTIAELRDQIADTERELAESSTNNTFLTAELKKQMEQLADLEHKFNDLKTVRAQVTKLRDEAFVARRLELMRDSAPEEKGAEMLGAHHVVVIPAANQNRSPQYDLNVEIGSDGSVKVLPPTGGATNTPVH